MSFLNSVMNKIAMNKMKHEKEMAALAATCQVSGNELGSVASCEDVASQCFYSSFQVGI